MIISKSSGFIFLSGVKIASSSAQVVLSQFVKDGDITSGWHDDTMNPYMVEFQDSIGIPHIDFDDYVKYMQPKVTFWPDSSTGSMDNVDNIELKTVIENAKTRGVDQKTILDIIASRLVKHYSPSECINAGILTEEDFEKNKYYCFIRDPIQRALSGYFYESDMNIRPERTVELTVEWIDSLPDYGPRFFMQKKYRDYFELNGKMLAKPLIFERFEDEMKNLITTHNGNIPETFPKFKSHTRPDWSKRPVEEWLPKESINKLKNILADDIEFYAMNA